MENLDNISIIIFLDRIFLEKKRILFIENGLKWTWRKPQHALQDYHVQGTFKHGGGSLMFWGCVTWNGVGQACKIEGTLDSTLYCEILSDNLLGTADYFQMDRDYFVFQDNDPKQTSRLAKDWFNQNRVNLMD